MKRLGILLALGTAVSAHALTLDDFLTGNYSGPFITTGSDIAFTPAASALGGSRYTNITILSNAIGGSARLRTSTSLGRLFVSNESGVGSAIKLGYGFSTTTPASAPLNLNMSSAAKVDVKFESNDLSMPVTVTLFTNGGTPSYSRTATISGGITSSFTQTFDFSADASLLGDVDAVEISFAPQVDGDFSLSNVSAVPEPATLVGLGVASIAFFKKRRRA